MINTGSMATDLLLQGSVGLRVYCGIIAFAFGAVFGSFMNCMAWRVVHKESVLHGRSHCAVCGHVLGPADLVPIFSYIFLKGKCRYCGEKISPRYLITEIILGSAFLTCFLKWGLSVDTLRWMAMAAVLLGLSLVDLESYTIPDRFLVAAIVIWAVTMPFTHTWIEAGETLTAAARSARSGQLAAGAVSAAGTIGGTASGEAAEAIQTVSFAQNTLRALWHGALGGIVIAGGMLAVSLIFDKVTGKESLGGGDIKLYFVTGLYLGSLNSLLCVILSCIIGLIFAAAARQKRIPFGPSISLAMFLCALFGQTIVRWYVGLLG